MTTAAITGPLMNAQEKIQHLRKELASTRAQRDKIRATRDTLKVKLDGSEQVRATTARSHFELWRDHVYPHHDTALPSADLVEHIAYKRGVTTDAGIAQLHEGYIAVQQIKQALAPLNLPLPTRILDFGCGYGRLSRYLSLLGEPGVAVDGCDVDAPAIEWASANLVSSGTFFVNPDRPPLSLPEENRYDLIIALSVFTHLPEDMQEAWLEQLIKLLRPDGRLLATIHGPYFHRFVPADQRDAFLHHGFLHCDLGRTPGLPDYYLTSFQSDEYVRSRWSRHGEIEAIVPMAVQLQDAVIVSPRRPTDDSGSA